MSDAQYDVFLSHNGRDKPTVEQIAERLKAVGIEPWLDSWCIDKGASFLQALEAGVHATSSCAVLIGPHGEGDWMTREVEIALDRAAKDKMFRVIPVLLPGLDEAFDPTSVRALLRVLAWVDLRTGPNDERAFQSLVHAIKHPGFRQIHQGPSNESENGLTPPQGHATAPSPLAPVSYLNENISEVQQYLKELTFTPIIGPGCSLIGRSQDVAWVQIAERMEALLADLDHEERATKYLRGLAAVPAYSVPLRTELANPPAPLARDPIVLLQLALTRLGATLGAVFAATMLESATPIWDTLAFSLTVARNHPDLETLPTLLLDACLAAHDASMTEEGSELASGLEAPGIYERLTEFAGELLDRRALTALKHQTAGIDQAATQSVLNDIEISQKQRRLEHAHADHHAGGIQLSSHQLEWVADALWHTFRFNQAAYPRSDELAFQISLLASGVRGRRPDLALAAQSGMVALTPSIVAAWFRRYSETSGAPMHNFYRALARILRAQYDSFRSPTSRPNAYLGGQPVAFSITYDLEMENALHRQDGLRAFHVVIPVNAYTAGDPTPERRWLLGTTRKDDAVEAPRWDWLPKDWNPDPESNTLEGPILIKLHGSPLHTLPTSWRQPNGHHFASLEHALVLAEIEYFQTMAWKDPLPKFFNRILLQKNRTLFFLGFSLQHWDSRLRLFNHVYRPDDKPRDIKRIAVTRSHDPYRSAVLKAIGIYRWIGDLEEITRIVNRSLP